jgi:SAM-dependent methyltransferase
MSLRFIARFLIQASPPLRRWWRRRRYSVATWEQFYAKEHDPFGFDRSPYEASKFAHLLKALEGRRYGRALEIGCSVGSFTEKLADVCDEVVGTDISQTAVDRTRQRLQGKSNVRIERQTFPVEQPAGKFDLVVCSDVLYYLSDRELPPAIRLLAGLVRPGGSLLALHYLGDAVGLTTGEKVHNQLLQQLSEFSSGCSETVAGVGPHGAGYRLDRLDRIAASHSPPFVAMEPSNETGPRRDF